MTAARIQNRFTVGTKIALGFGIALIMLISVGAVSRNTQDELRDNSRWVVHTYDVLAQLSQSVALIRTAEAEARAYALTGQPHFLERLEDAKVAARGELSKIVEATRDNPDQQRRLAELSRMLDRRFEVLSEMVQTRTKEGSAAAAAIVEGPRTQSAVQALAGVIDAAQRSERELLKRRLATSEDSMAGSTRYLLWAVVTGLFAVGVVGFLIGRDISQQVRAREGMIGAITDAVQQLASATAELLAAATQQGSGAQEQAAAIAETATTAEEIAQTAAQAAERIRAVAEQSQRSAQATNDGKRSVDDTVERISTLKERVGQMAENILKLSENAQSIQELTSVVSDLAEQSNVLALNAAIEASRAGEHGRGFSVVAAEVRGLAEQSKKATKQVTALLGEIQRQTNKAVMITEEGTKSADKAVTSVAAAGEMFGDIAARVSESAQAALQVAASASQQALGVSQIQQAMRDINQVTTQSLASTKQIERASHDLSVLSTRLRDLIGREHA